MTPSQATALEITLLAEFLVGALVLALLLAHDVARFGLTRAPATERLPWWWPLGHPVANIGGLVMVVAGLLQSVEGAPAVIGRVLTLVTMVPAAVFVSLPVTLRFAGAQAPTPFGVIRTCLGAYLRLFVWLAAAQLLGSSLT